MNKKFANFLSSYNMTINGNSAYGLIDGYETNFHLVMMDNQSPVRLHFSCYTTDEQKRNISDNLRKAAIKFCRFEFTGFGLFLVLNDITVGRLIKRLPDIFNTVLGILKDNGAVGAGCCPVCGKPCTEETAKPYQMEIGTIILDNECAGTINTVIAQENQDFEQAPNNYLRGFIGAVIGGVVGAVICIIFYLIGFVSGLSSIVAVALGAFLYAKFGGKQNKMMIVIVSATTLVLMVLSILGLYIVASPGLALEEYGMELSGTEAFKFMLDNDEFKRGLISDILMVIVFSVIGIVIEVVYLSKKIKRKKQMNSVY